MVSSSHGTSQEQKALSTYTSTILQPCLRRLVDNFNCNNCQRNKLDGKGYRFLLEREVRSISFEECDTDLIGPWTVQVCGRPYEFMAFTAIDTVANLVELIRIDNKESRTVARQTSWKCSKNITTRQSLAKKCKCKAICR